MHSIKGTIAFCSAIILGAGFSILAPRTSAAQNRREQPRSVQAAPSQNNEHRGGEGNHQNSGRQRQNSRTFTDNNVGRYNFADRDRNRGGDRDRDRDRHGRDRNLNLGLFWGGTPDYGYPYGYNQGFYSGPYGYYGSDSYDVGYSDGFNAGQFDRSQGYLYNPRQYERSGNPEYFEGFVAGYQDGFNHY